MISLLLIAEVVGLEHFPDFNAYNYLFSFVFISVFNTLCSELAKFVHAMLFDSIHYNSIDIPMLWAFEMAHFSFIIQF